MWIHVVIVLFFIVMPLPVWAMSGMPRSENMTTGSAAPDFTLPTIAGYSMSLTQAREGKRAVLFFWATWCPHCHEELKMIRQNLDTYQQKGLQIILVNVGESKEEAKAYLKYQGISLDSFVDEDNTVAGQYNVVGIPAIYLIDEQGIIRDASHGLPKI